MALKDFSRTVMLPMRVWDAPTRLFHWAIVILVAVSYVSVRNDAMRMHLWSGYAVLALLLFRLVWGFAGSETARFAAFLVSPVRGLHHLSRLARQEPDTQIGHNEAGGWMVLLLLLLLAIQVGTGLCSNDDGATEGPLARIVGKENSDWLSGVHALNFNILLAVIVLHVLAVFAYAVIKRHDLVRPMITGKKRLPAATPAPRMASPLLALLVIAVCAAIAWAVGTWL